LKVNERKYKESESHHTFEQISPHHGKEKVHIARPIHTYIYTERERRGDSGDSGDRGDSGTEGYRGRQRETEGGNEVRYCYR